MAAVLSSPNTPNFPPQSSLPSRSESRRSESPSGVKASLAISPPERASPTQDEQTPIATEQRASTYSQSNSRHTSVVFPLFHSSLSYALVRDFAYQPTHPLHYGPIEEDSGLSTPSSHFDTSRRSSDPQPNWDSNRSMFSAGPWGDSSHSQGQQLPSTSFDGDDISDEEYSQSGRRLSRHRRSKSYAHMDYTRGRRRSSRERERKSIRPQQPGLDSQGLDSQGLFQTGTEADDPSRIPTSLGAAFTAAAHGQQSGTDRTDSPVPSTLPHDAPHSAPPPGLSLDIAAAQHPPFREDIDGVPDSAANAYHRPSSTSLDESFAGPSLALYDFAPENANELALREGQIIQVGYRHGQGWLVAMDMDTGEQGLVPEEYVRLLRDIEGWGEEEEGELEEEEGEEEEGETEEGVDEGAEGVGVGVEIGGARKGGGGGGGGGGAGKGASRGHDPET